MSKPKWVRAKELAHLIVPVRYHLWQSIDGKNKTLNNTPLLMKGIEGERYLNFKTEYYWELMARFYPHPTLKNTPVNGFYFADHLLKVNNVAVGEVWNEQIEAYLILRGVVVYKASVPELVEKYKVLELLSKR